MHFWLTEYFVYMTTFYFSKYFTGKEKGSERIIAFGTAKFLEYLAMSEQWYIDGVFKKYLPDIVRQSYTFSGKLL